MNYHKSYMLIVFVLLALFNLSFGQLLDAVNHPKFENALPIPMRLDASVPKTWQMEMNQTTQWLGLYDGPDPATANKLITTVWGYGEVGKGVTYPGPTFVAEKNTPVKVFWYNNLPKTGHIIPVDYNLHMAHPAGVNTQTFYEAGNIPAVVHLHGGHTESASDGLPEAWYTQGWNYTGPHFVKKKYFYDNDQEAATLWYHDHALGITRLNVYAGLAGFYLLRDKNERNLSKFTKKKAPVLPSGPYEIEIVIQDRNFDINGQLFLPAKDGDPFFDGNVEVPIDPDFIGDNTHVAEFFGDFIIVNGMAWPKLNVEPRKYRFRLLNGSDSRVYRLKFDDGTSFWQIGTDNGLLPVLVEISELVIAPGERADLVIDFSTKTQLFLQNTGPDEPFKGTNWNPDVSRPTGQIMRFDVNLPVNTNIPPATINVGVPLRPPIVPLPETGATVRELVLFEGEDEFGRLQPLLGTLADGSLGWFEPITENPMLNDIEVWEVYNATEDAHPIHLHLVSFQILSRQSFDGSVATKDQPQHNDKIGVGGTLTVNSLIGTPRDPSANENGWKDTAVMLPGEVTRVIAKFDREGRYVWHCHILSHEDHEMMRPYYVGTMTAPANQLIAQDQTANTNVSDRITPEKFALDANFPNPFNPITNIRFQLPETGNVELKIFNTLGQEIITLASGSYEAGVHNVVWNARDRYGNQVPSGLYVYRLTDGNFVQERKMMLLK